MQFEWIDYTNGDAQLVDSWLDEHAISMTGVDCGWDAYWNAVLADSVHFPGCRDYCKLVCLDQTPVAAIVFGCYQGEAVISELVVDPARRSMGLGRGIIQELVSSVDSFFDEEIHHISAVVFASNLASQKAFQGAGFLLDRSLDEATYSYIYKLDHRR